MEAFIRGLPKAELHIHIEGSLEPEMMFGMAERNGISLPFGSVDEVRAAYEFTDLQSFLDIYYQAAEVLQTEQDFYDLMWAYLERVHRESVTHAEVFFDPQTHTGRGIPFGVVIGGLSRASVDARATLGISSFLIMCFLRHLPESDAFQTLEQASDFKDSIIAVGLDSSEVGHPPEDFASVFAAARQQGFRAVAHAGEEGPAQFITDSLDLLLVERIDHGVNCEQDPQLVERLVDEQVPLTMCPLSSVKLRVFNSIGDHSLKRLLDGGVKVTVNSDDPAYFGGYLTDNYLAVQPALGLDRADVVQLARNSFEASFLDDDRKARLIGELEGYARSEG